MIQPKINKRSPCPCSVPARPQLVLSVYPALISVCSGGAAKTFDVSTPKFVVCLKNVNKNTDLSGYTYRGGAFAQFLHLAAQSPFAGRSDGDGLGSGNGFRHGVLRSRLGSSKMKVFVILNDD